MAGKVDLRETHIDISSELSRDLTLFQITMMGLGMMIGAGVFLGIGNSIYEAGPGGVLLTFTLNGLIATFTALSYAELSSAVPRAGGAIRGHSLPLAGRRTLEPSRGAVSHRLDRGRRGDGATPLRAAGARRAVSSRVDPDSRG